MTKFPTHVISVAISKPWNMRSTVFANAFRTRPPGNCLRPWYAFAMNPGKGLDAYKIVLYRQDDGSWVAEVPAIAGCYALMPTREEALAELGHAFT